MAVLNVPVLRDLAPDLVVSDVITACGGLAAELLGLPWVELNPHPLYRPSKGLPPLGSGLAPGVGVRGRLRDAVMRALTARSWREGLRQRSAARVEIGLPRRSRPAAAADRHAARAGGAAPGLARRGRRRGAAALRADVGGAGGSGRDGPVVVVAPSTAMTGTRGLAELALESLMPGEVLPEGSRVVVSRLAGPMCAVPPWAVVGLGRQDELLSHADLVICGGGHGMVSKTLLAGVPLVVVPGGGDQWEIANRVVRQGSAQLVRPLTAEALAAAVARCCRRRAIARPPGGPGPASPTSSIRYGCAMKRWRSSA